MEREPGIGRDKPDGSESDWNVADWGSDDALSAYLASLPPCPGIKFIDDDAEEEDREADLDRAAGRLVPHELVAAWIRKLGTPDEEPMPPEWLS